MRIVYIFKPFDKDPDNPWAVSMGFLGREAKRLRVGVFAAIVALVFVICGLYVAAKDASFIYGSKQTTARLIKITGQHPEHGSSTSFTGSFRYMAAGAPHGITETKNSKKFPATVHAVYKTADPAKSQILYQGTLWKTILWAISSGIIVAAGIYVVFYRAAIFGRRYLGWKPAVLALAPAESNRRQDNGRQHVDDNDIDGIQSGI